MYKLGINFDEISEDLDAAIEVMLDNDIRYGELRTVGGKNFVFWSQDEIEAFRNKVDAAGIEVVAAATPLFKWYDHADDPEVEHDSFGFDPRLSETSKREVIAQAIHIANQLNIPRLRIFSGLGAAENAGETFGKSELLQYAVDLAAKRGVDLYIENEPPCKIHTKKDIAAVLATMYHPNLKFWLDIANFIEVGENIDDEFLATVKNRLGYLHIKDFVIEQGNRKYVPAGTGQIAYAEILRRVHNIKPSDIVITIETHAQENKVAASVASIRGTRTMLKEVGVLYE
jgi:sugar phosphate isomerase/epimerase